MNNYLKNTFAYLYKATLSLCLFGMSESATVRGRTQQFGVDYNISQSTWFKIVCFTPTDHESMPFASTTECILSTIFGFGLHSYVNEFNICELKIDSFIFSDLLSLSCNERLQLLESLLSEPDGDKKLSQSLNLEDNFKGHQFSLDALLDTFILLYDECSNSSLRREKSVSDFLKLGI